MDVNNQQQPADGDTDTLLSPVDVANKLAVPLGTVRDWRYKGVGPKSFRVGRHVRYYRSDVLAWIEERATAG